MPFRAERYPKDWKAISLRIRERSGGQCECLSECGLHPDHRCVEMNGQQALFARGKIVLTVAHLEDPNPQNCAETNLKAMCQRCHLRYDLELHMQHRAENQRQRAIEAGQVHLWAVCSDPRLDEVGRRKGWEVG